jgi:methionyl-tRNA formyltransferase
MNTCSPFWRPYTALRAAGRLSSSHQVYRSYLHSSARDRKYNGLRILFCGADNFSIESLRAVHGLQEKQPDKIASIEVVCRPDKRVGRGLKQIREGLLLRQEVDVQYADLE